VPLPGWALPAGAAIISAGLLVFAAHQTKQRRPAALFCLVWFLATVAPVLPLRDHLSEYYIYLPLIGICMLGGWGVAAGWRAGTPAKSLAVALAALYVFMTLPRTWAASEWNLKVSLRTEDLVGGVARAHELHPGKAILLYGVDTEMFLNAVKDRAFRLAGAGDVFVAPESRRTIQAETLAEYILPAEAVNRTLLRDELVVYDVRGPRLRNMTAIYRSMPRESGLPARLDAASPLTAYLLGPEWYAIDGNHRWMPRRASFRIAAPSTAGETLYLSGNCSEEQLGAGPLKVTAFIDAAPVGSALIRDSEFRLAFPLPQSVVGKPEMRVAIEVDRAFHTPGDLRELGLVFGSFEVR
jgi:hypothetical protein